MSVVLESATVQKLTHESTEIRLRTLQQITTKLQRALTHNEQVHFKPGELCKQLIRWFGYQPIQTPSQALQLLLLVLNSSYADKAIKQLGVERFKREVEKVKLLLKHQANELGLVKQIQQALREFKQRQNRENIENLGRIFDNCSIKEISDDETEPQNDCKSQLIQCPPIDYEPAWSKPTSADFTALKLLADLLANPLVEDEELQNGLLHLQITMQDYPAEYMLQAPYVFLNLLHLYGTAEDEKLHPLEDITNTLQVFLQNLIHRLRMRRNVLAYAVTHKSAQSLAATQLKIGRTVHLLMEKSLKLLQLLVQDFRKETSQIWQIITTCMEIYQMQHWCIRSGLLIQLCKICVTLKECCEQEEHFTLHRMKYLLFVNLLEDMLLHNSKHQPCMEIQLLEPLFLDYSFKKNFPCRYNSLKELVIKAIPICQNRFEKLQKYEACFEIAIELLKTPNCMQNVEIVSRGREVCIALQKMNCAKLAEQLFNAVVSCNTLYHSKPELKVEANELLLNLLRVTNVPIKISIYKALAMAVKKHFVCLMNSENYCMGVTQSQLLDSHIIGVPLNTTLLVQLVYDSADSIDPEISEHSEAILVLLLKSQHLLGEHWNKLLEIMLPVLPLLQCCTKSRKIMKLLMKLYNPDCEHLPFLEVLQGNTIFLFHREQAVRSEALTRLIYILNILPDKDDYVPNLAQISDVIPNDLCILKTPRELKRIFVNGGTFNDADTLHNLLNLLETPDIEPLIRKTTLMQLNVMCQQFEITTAFSNASAYYLVLQALENSMQVKSYADYTGAAIPAVGILCKVFLYDIKLRLELAHTPNIYMLLLRALFLYQNDIQLRQDACICLFMLLFSSFLVVLGNQRIEAPCLIGNLQVPLGIELKSFAQCNCDVNEYDDIFRNTNEENIYLRQVLASKFCGEHSKINKKYLELQNKYEFENELRLTHQDWSLIKASIPELNVRRFLRAISNATVHKAVINATVSLQLQLLVKDDTIQISNELTQELFNLINKYVQLPPGNEMDYTMFEHLLDLCELCITLPLPNITALIADSLAGDSQHAFIALLKNAKLELRLYYKISKLLRETLKAATASVEMHNFHSNLFELLFELITELFQKRDLQRVRCLLMVQQVLAAKSLNMRDDKLYFYSKRFVNLSLALKSSTQTGAQWQRDCLSIACQLYNQMSAPQQVFKIKESGIRYLSGLCGHNDRQVRSLAWCLLKNAAQFNDGSETSGYEILNNELSYLPGGFMACCLCTLLDVAEIVLVREIAGDVFSEFIGKVSCYEEICMLLEQHNFFQLANDAISETCLMEEKLPLHFDHAAEISITTCGLISCYCRICIKLLQLEPAFITILCETTFMYKLYEIFKLPPSHENPAYSTMCADICQVYGLCYQEKFEFLQRTLCRDQVWMMSFYQLLNLSNFDGPAIVNILQLMMVLCKDELAHMKLCEKYAKAPQFLNKMFLRAFTISHLNTPFQHCALAILTLLLIRSQNEPPSSKQGCFVSVLESNLEICESSCPENDSIAQMTQETGALKKQPNLVKIILHLWKRSR